MLHCFRLHLRRSLYEDRALHFPLKNRFDELGSLEGDVTKHQAQCGFALCASRPMVERFLSARVLLSSLPIRSLRASIFLDPTLLRHQSERHCSPTDHSHGISFKFCVVKILL
jgi:hypothetical protein